ncbi:pentalenolactone D synthase [Microdochium nivale]|nr:pentalenolactone D synthase [Microdochium nivale]
MANSFAEIEAKYTAEAQKRLRSDGEAQFQDLEKSDNDRLRHLAGDPWADHKALDALSPPITPGSHYKFLIVGAGISGLVTAVRLIEAGFTADQIRLVDGAGGVGGTWYWNRYPGIHCDVEAYTYMPLLPQTGYMPSKKYASGTEIRRYLNLLAKKFNLDDKILLRTTVDSLDWDESSNVWKASLTAGRGPNGAEKSNITTEADFVVLTSGLLAKPHVPKLPGAGLPQFKGELLHTARWDYAATGGSSEEVFPNLDKLKGKRVGIIGTGATAIQVLPILADYAGELFVFQRTPSAVYSRGQRETTQEEWAEITRPGDNWQMERQANNTMNITLPKSSKIPDLVNDQWSQQKAYTALIGGPQYPVPTPEQIPELIRHFLDLDAENSARVRARIASIIEDKETAEKLTPWYPIWCKRPTFSDTYLPAFNKSHVHLVDTDGKGVSGATEKGLVVGDTEYPLDVLVLATGYVAPRIGTKDPAERAGVQVTGKGGRTLASKWEAQGPTTLHGVISNGFPNLLWHNFAQAGISGNQSEVIDVQARHIARIIAAAHKKVSLPFVESNQEKASRSGAGVVFDVDPEAEEGWSMRCASGATRFAATSICTPSYLNNQGEQLDKTDQAALLKTARGAPLAEGLLKYGDILREWHEAGTMEGLLVSGAAV